MLPSLLALQLSEAGPQLVAAIVNNARSEPALLRALLPRLRGSAKLREFETRSIDLLTVYLKSRAAELGGADPATAAFIIVHGVQGIMAAAIDNELDQAQIDKLASELTRVLATYLGMRS